MEAVIYALGEIGGESVKKAFIHVIEDYSDEDVLESTEDTLRELREKEMPESLKKAFETCTDLELGNEEECDDEWLLTYSLKEKLRVLPANRSSTRPRARDHLPML